LDRQLALLGLRVKNITADGNCFFRALSDQLQGDEGQHSELRAQVCALMAEQAEDFAPFVEDDQTLETYLARMKREGVWAGHMELQVGVLGWLVVNVAYRELLILSCY
jgi:OTU domain-containing protein 3